MLVGIISDIHGMLSDEAVHALEPCDIILCAGDVQRDSILMELDAIAPTIAIRGNCDGAVTSNIPLSASPRIGGIRFFMVHRPQDIGTPADDIEVVVHGHTHVPRDQFLNNVRYINPGSPTRPRNGSKKGLAHLTIELGQVISVEFITLE